jgi:mono/diheme cytochrome c family protein
MAMPSSLRRDDEIPPSRVRPLTRAPLPKHYPGATRLRGMPHLSELHGAATHLAVIAVPVYLLILLVRRAGRGGSALRAAEPWVIGASVAGVLLAGVTGLLVWGQAQTMLRGNSFRIGTVHFWLGIATTALVLVLAGWRRFRVASDRHTHSVELVAGGLIALAAVLAQGYLGGRMTYNHGVGVYDAGVFAQTATGKAQLDVALAGGASPAAAGKAAFSASGLGCALCHGDRAQGLRGPRLAGGVDVADFRRVHGHLLFPERVIGDREFAAIDAYLKTLRR